ncbi:MAG: hypothetical protein EZS28_024726, partial [Streblomastix strix]
MDILPPELLFQIFLSSEPRDVVKSFALVCEQWYEISVIFISTQRLSDIVALQRRWREGLCTVNKINANTDGVRAIQVQEHLIIGVGLSGVIKIWHTSTGKKLRAFASPFLFDVPPPISFESIDDERRQLRNRRDQEQKKRQIRENEDWRDLNGYTTQSGFIHKQRNRINSHSNNNHLYPPQINISNAQQGSLFTLQFDQNRIITGGEQGRLGIYSQDPLLFDFDLCSLQAPQHTIYSHSPSLSQTPEYYKSNSPYQQQLDEKGSNMDNQYGLSTPKASYSQNIASSRSLINQIDTEQSINSVSPQSNSQDKERSSDQIEDKQILFGQSVQESLKAQRLKRKEKQKKQQMYHLSSEIDNSGEITKLKRWQIPTVSIQTPHSQINSLSFVDDTLLTGGTGDNNSIIIWDIRRRAEEYEYENE